MEANFNRKGSNAPSSLSWINHKKYIVDWRDVTWAWSVENRRDVRSTKIEFLKFTGSLVGRMHYPDANINFCFQSRQIVFQSTLICAVNFLTSAIYVIENYIAVPFWIVISGQFCWQLGSAAPLLIYFIFNKTIRNGVWIKTGLKVWFLVRNFYLNFEFRLSVGRTRSAHCRKTNHEWFL